MEMRATQPTEKAKRLVTIKLIAMNVAERFMDRENASLGRT
jgi:hypothetical protein